MSEEPGKPESLWFSLVQRGVTTLTVAAIVFPSLGLLLGYQQLTVAARLCLVGFAAMSGTMWLLLRRARRGKRRR